MHRNNSNSPNNNMGENNLETGQSAGPNAPTICIADLEALRESIDDKFMFLCRQFGELTKKQGEQNQILETTNNNCNSLQKAFMDHVQKSCVVPHKDTNGSGINTNDHNNSLHGELEPISNTLSRDLDYVGQNPTSTTAPQVSLELLNIPGLSGTNLAGVQQPIESYPQSSVLHTREPVELKLLNIPGPSGTNLAGVQQPIKSYPRSSVLHTQEPVELKLLNIPGPSGTNLPGVQQPVEITPPSVSDLPHCSIKRSFSDSMKKLAKLAEQKDIDKKRRFFKNKYNYLVPPGKVSHPYCLNNCTINAQVDYKTGETIIIPEHYFKNCPKPMIFLTPVLKIRKCDE